MTSQEQQKSEAERFTTAYRRTMAFCLICVGTAFAGASLLIFADETIPSPLADILAVITAVAVLAGIVGVGVGQALSLRRMCGRRQSK